MNEDKFYRISVKGLILNDSRDKFLVVLEESGRWDLFGGGQEHGESAEECLHREAQEEMGVKISRISPTPCYYFTGQFQNEKRKGQWYANVVYEVALESLEFAPSNECSAIQFVSPEEAFKLHAFNAVHELARQFRKENHAT
jgi:8-oxo-dGTP diphosphatase